MHRLQATHVSSVQTFKEHDVNTVQTDPADIAFNAGILNCLFGLAVCLLVMMSVTALYEQAGL